MPSKKKVIPPAKVILEKIVTENSDFLYTNLPAEWQVQDIVNFSANIHLYPYQQKALQCVSSVLYTHFSKKALSESYAAHGRAEIDSLNRACFWMATGSGKTLVLIKLVEHLDYLIEQGLIPNREFLLLLPKEDLVEQFKKQIKEFNAGRTRKIELINLKNYDEEKNSFGFKESIKIYYYRSDLLRDQKKENQIDYKNYENNGEWYVFLDEAHRGDNENSNLKDYVKKLSANGFLFNFSATFTDDIDIETTCFNFNLEKFINEGYGKNILISKSNYAFKNKKDDFSMDEKQKQVLKSFIIYTLLKQSHTTGVYHKPLMVSLVNSVQKTDKNTNSDLSLFCNYMLKIAQNETAIEAEFEEAKKELVEEFQGEQPYYFGTERVSLSAEKIQAITLSDIRRQAFNSPTIGQLEYYEGIKGKEIIFKLASANEPFALIRIGETDPFIKTYLHGYTQLSSYAPRNWFSNINEESSSINVLLGSRSFYEGWDSNRPNIINMINIGSSDAKKFIPQSIGRGIRIQPDPNDIKKRKRLPVGDKNKNSLLETLFIFPTDRKSIECVLDTMVELSGKEKSVKQKLDINILERSDRKFDLLVPSLRESNEMSISPFLINEKCKEKLQGIFSEMSPAAFLLASCHSSLDKWSLRQYDKLLHYFIKGDHFVVDNNLDYKDYQGLVGALRRHMTLKEKKAEGVRLLCEEAPNEDIIHFKHIEVNMPDANKTLLQDEILKTRNFGKYTTEELLKMIKAGTIGFAEAEKLAGKANASSFEYEQKTLNIIKLAEHYYMPLLYADNDKVDFISHIVKQESEINFVKSLLSFVSKEKERINCEWMFSKIDETLDRICVPYFSGNTYKNFYPDFIFWQKGNNGKYKITFVDPKGTKHIDWTFKVDGFKKLFYDASTQKPRTFAYQSNGETFSIQVDLKLVKKNAAEQISEEYKNWWIGPNDFAWLKDI